jgi:hypothetical protein
MTKSRIPHLFISYAVDDAMLARWWLARRRRAGIVLNKRRMSELHSIGWDDGAAEFKASLRDQILLPARRAHYPDPDYLVFCQQLRGWSQRQLG